MGILRLFWAAMLVVVLGGCATVDSYVEYQNDDAAYLSNKMYRQGLTTWQRYDVLSIDDKFINNVFGGPKRKIAPGEHEIVVQAVFNRGFGNGPFEAFIPIQVNLEAGHEYELNGEFVSGQMLAWVIDIQTGKKMIAAEPASIRTQPRPVVIPIFIPSS